MTEHHVLIAGGGIAGLEALAALRALAGPRVDVTLLSPSPTFALRADAVAAAFGRPAPPEHDVARIAADHGARFLRDALHAVRREYRLALTESGRELRYDALLVAVGAHTRPHPALHAALTFRDLRDVPAMAGVLADLEAGRASSLMYVVPPGASWTLPAYELALLSAEFLRERSCAAPITVATPEGRPVAELGAAGSAVIERSLHARGIALRNHLPIARLLDDRLLDVRGRTLARADRVVALPALTGPALRGLPHDRDGYLPVDDHGVVRGVLRTFGAGDATTQPCKQGGLAAQQAAVAAHAIARAAGADVAELALHPTLRAHSAAGPGPTWFWSALPGEPGGSTTSETPLWWPPLKVSMPYLGAYLAGCAAPGVSS